MSSTHARRKALGIFANADLRFAALCLILVAGLSLPLGQDANWDLRNYHYYNPHSWVSGRADIDIAPAQSQTFHNPLADLPFYALVRAGTPSWIIGFVLTLPAAVALFLLYRIAMMLLPERARPYSVAAILVLAATAASGGPLIGTTMSEWHVYTLFAAAIYLALRQGVPGLQENQSDSALVWLGCGLLGGSAVGLKLNGGTYAIALAALVLTLPGDWVRRIRRTALLGVGGVLGLAIAYGPWGLDLWRRFGNPFFPYFNNVFQSPWADPVAYSDSPFDIRSVVDILTLPWQLMKESHGLVSEPTLRDWRLGLGLPAIAWLAFGPKPLTRAHAQAWRGLSVFLLTGYLLWVRMYGIFRYAGLLEIVASLAIVALVVQMAGKRALIAVFVVAVIVVATTKWPFWGRVPHGVPAVVATVPDLPPRSMVVIASPEPVGYAVPSLPPDVPVVSLDNNLMRLGSGRARLQIVATERVKDHPGPMWLLLNRRNEKEEYAQGSPAAQTLRSLGFSADLNDCRSIITGMDDDLALCRLDKL